MNLKITFLSVRTISSLKDYKEKTYEGRLTCNPESVRTEGASNNTEVILLCYNNEK